MTNYGSRPRDRTHDAVAVRSGQWLGYSHEKRGTLQKNHWLVTMVTSRVTRVVTGGNIRAFCATFCATQMVFHSTEVDWELTEDVR